MEVALDPASAPLYEEVGDNIAYHDTFTYGDVDAAFSSADRVITETFRQHRYINVPMETRGSVATYDTATGELTYYAGTQAHNATRFFLGAQLNLPGHRIRVIAPDIGGAFGLKFGVYREDMVVAAAAIKTGRRFGFVSSGVVLGSCCAGSTVVAALARASPALVVWGRMLVSILVAADAELSCAVPASLPSDDESRTSAVPSARQNASVSSFSTRLHAGQRFINVAV